MTLEGLRDLYLNAPKTGEILSALERDGATQAHLKGSIGSHLAFLIDALSLRHGGHQLVLMNDKEEAAFMFNDLQALKGDGQVLFFPASYRRAYQVDQTDNANVLERARVLNTIGKSRSPRIIVSFPEAIAEKVVTRKSLKQNTLQIKRGEKYSIDFLIEVFNEYGFERTDFVHEPGQYSIRGGIIDLFSFSSGDPYRIELFGDEVESIRPFDNVTQLSKNAVQRLDIIPNIREHIQEEAKVNLLEFVQQNCVVWLKDRQLYLDVLKVELDKVAHAYEALTSELNHAEPVHMTTPPDEFAALLDQSKTVDFGTGNTSRNDNVWSLEQSPQPSFNKNFELLSSTLKSYSDQQYHNVIATQNSKQVERLYEIFEDIGKEVEMLPIVMSLHQGFVDHDLKVVCFTDHQIFNRYHKFNLEAGYKKTREALTIQELNSLQPGDFITHIDHGVGQFSGLEKIEVNGKMQEAIRIFYKNKDVLYVSIHSLHRISKYVGKEGKAPKMDKLGSPAWKKLKQKTKSRVKEIAFDLIKLYAERKTKKGFQFSPDNYLQTELEASFLYEDTPDQMKATEDVKRDMESENPMDRLVCGDVGFGKTEVAIRAAFKAVCDSKQVAILVPTTILALQHFKTFEKRLKDLPCTVDYLNRFKSAGKQKDTIKRLKSGEIDILIGTHRLVSKDVEFKDLGLLIIDEEQKFGVGTKDKLKSMKSEVDTLTLTATPIPRTLQFSMMGARDLSVINTPPPNRQTILTELHPFNEEVIRDAINYEILRRGQVFFINNRVDNILDVAGMINRLCPEARVLVAHGQMKGDELERKMLSFINGEHDVLVATTIIESGLDIPNANTIIINQANHFGLSDLHQMRGRVGRSNKKAFCYLLAPPMLSLTPEARKRLTAIEQFSDLGSGFQIAMRDLDIRGAGDLLGGEQSGFISEIGFEMYQKILNEAVQELKDNEFKSLYEHEKKEFLAKDCQIETDLEILIPDDYVTNITERVRLYKELDEIATEEALMAFQEKLIDRFGPIPGSVQTLIQTMRMRWVARKLGIEKLILKQGKLITYFISDPESEYFNSPTFTSILKYIQFNHASCRMREKNDRLSMVCDQVKSVTDALDVMRKMLP